MYSSILALTACYLMGSLPTSYLLGKILRDIDIREYGSGNVGATNTFRVLGRLPGVFCLLVDIGKGVVAVTVIPHLLGLSQIHYVKILAGLAVIAGHNWSLFLKFKGGKGVATSTGVLLGLTPITVTWVAIIWAIVVFVTRYVSLGSIIAVIALPLIALIRKEDIHLFYFTILIAVLVVVRHRANLKRLLEGSESRIGKRGEQSEK